VGKMWNSAFRILPTIPQSFPHYWIPHFTFRIPHSAILHFTNTAVPHTLICSRLWKFQNRYKIPVHSDRCSVSQFILEANRQPKSIGEKISAIRNFFADFAECPDLIRNRRLSVFISVCPSLFQSILVYPDEISLDHRISQLIVVYPE